MTPLPYMRAALMKSPTDALPDEPVAVIGMGFADFLVVGLDGVCHVVPFAEVQIVDPAVRTIARSAVDEIAHPEPVAA